MGNQYLQGTVHRFRDQLQLRSASPNAVHIGEVVNGVKYEKQLCSVEELVI